ncbi:twinfilin TWF1 PWA37_002057 [Arxiozyma heterogenica]|uniref:twinfilin TWF1 n=1 Tax=Arxiozyma heterogenica TaxID=278026 RepID=UPI002F0354F7
MSNQSGITADQELLDILNNSKQQNDSQYLIVVAKISQDSNLVKFSTQFTLLEQLKQNLGDEPLYIFIKNFQKDTKHYNFVSFVPDNSSIRSKMIYASTKNTLLREVGSNILDQQILATDFNDITDTIKETKINENALLTEHEKIELQINQQQRQMQLQSAGGHQLVSQTNGVSTQLKFEVDVEGGSLIEQLEGTNLISFKIDSINENVKIDSKKNISTPTDIVINTEHPTYTLYKNGNLIYFIYACPSGSKVKDRMLYASNRSGFLKYLREEQGLSIARVIEIGEPDELEISLISTLTQEDLDKEVHHDSTVKKFNRPKGPGRRKRI